MCGMQLETQLANGQVRVALFWLEVVFVSMVSQSLRLHVSCHTTGQQLAECSLYGIRVYKTGAVLAPHVDRMPLVSSAIINVDQDGMSSFVFGSTKKSSSSLVFLHSVSLELSSGRAMVRTRHVFFRARCSFFCMSLTPISFAASVSIQAS
jgi:hypothetical protein